MTTSIHLNNLDTILKENSELVRNLLENHDDNNKFTFEIPFSAGILNDLLNENYNVSNYKEIIGCMDFLLMDMDYYNNVIYKIIDIVGILKMKDIYIKNTIFYNRIELKTVCDEWIKNDVKCFKKYGYINYWNVSNVKNMYGIFHKCKFNETFDISKWNVSKVENMSDMFRNCQLNNSFNISKWDVSNVKDMTNMFRMCKLNETFDITKWDISSSPAMYYTFLNCDLSNFVELETWFNNNVTEKMTNMLYGIELNNEEQPLWLIS